MKHIELDRLIRMYDAYHNKDCVDFSYFKEIYECIHEEYTRMENFGKKCKDNSCIDLSHFVSVDPKRFFLQGYYCEDNFKIATDAKQMVMIESDGENYSEQKIINPKSFMDIDGIFPKYKKVIPSEDYVEFDTELFKDILKHCVAHFTIKSRKKMEQYYIGFNIDVPEIASKKLGVNLWHMKCMLEFMDVYKAAKVYMYSKRCFTYGNSESTDWMLKGIKITDGKNIYVGMPVDTPMNHYNYASDVMELGS